MLTLCCSIPHLRILKHIIEVHSKTPIPSVTTRAQSLHCEWTVTVQWLWHSVVTVDNCWQHGDYTQSLCCRQFSTVTTQSLSSHSVVTVPNRWLMKKKFCCVAYMNITSVVALLKGFQRFHELTIYLKCVFFLRTIVEGILIYVIDLSNKTYKFLLRTCCKLIEHITIGMHCLNPVLRIQAYADDSQPHQTP